MTLAKSQVHRMSPALRRGYVGGGADLICRYAPIIIAILSNSTYNLTCLDCTGIGSLELDVFTFDQLDEFMRDSRQ